MYWIGNRWEKKNKFEWNWLVATQYIAFKRVKNQKLRENGYKFANWHTKKNGGVENRIRMIRYGENEETRIFQEIWRVRRLSWNYFGKNKMKECREIPMRVNKHSEEDTFTMTVLHQNCFVLIARWFVCAHIDVRMARFDVLIFFDWLFVFVYVIVACAICLNQMLQIFSVRKMNTSKSKWFFSNITSSSNTLEINVSLSGL